MGLTVSAPKVTASQGPADWQAMRREIIGCLDLRSEFEALGVRFPANSRLQSNGWIDCHATDRPDENPSASVNLLTGFYRDRLSGEKAISLFDLAAKEGRHSDWLEAMRKYGEQVGVEVPRPYRRKDGSFVLQAYSYRDADGTLAYETVRMQPKTFRQRQVLPDGSLQWDLGGVTPLPYRLPDLLAADPSRPVLILEGEKDVDRAYELGFVATTGHGGCGNTKVWDQIAGHLAGRDAVVVPDNDGAGRKHAEGICERLASVARSVRVLELPDLPAKGDLSDWLDQGGTATELAGLADSAKPWEANAALTPPPSPPGLQLFMPEEENPNEGLCDPDRLARVYLRKHHFHPELPTALRWRADWYTWDGYRWLLLEEEEEFEGKVRTEIKREMDQAANLAADGKPPREVTITLVNNTMAALKSQAMLSTRNHDRQPCWIGGRRPGDPPIEAIVPCRNGLLHLDANSSDGPKVYPLTPRFFSVCCLPFDYLPNLPRPIEWLTFLHTLWEGDLESIGTLQEWFGYMLVQDKRFQKMLFIDGPPRSGKGTICDVLIKLVGEENVATPGLADLGERFGLWPMVTNPVAVISETEIDSSTSRKLITNRLKKISGNDHVQAERKNVQNPWKSKPPTRITIAGNLLPTLVDKSDALASRFVFLKLTKSFRGKEDLELFGRLEPELPAILNWAIEGFYRLYRRGNEGFIQPESGKSIARQFAGLSNNMTDFVEEQVLIGAGLRVLVSDAYEAWTEHCQREGINPIGSKSMFGRDLMAAIPTVDSRTGRDKDAKDSDPKRYYFGITLRKFADAPPRDPDVPF